MRRLVCLLVLAALACLAPAQAEKKFKTTKKMHVGDEVTYQLVSGKIHYGIIEEVRSPYCLKIEGGRVIHVSWVKKLYHGKS